MADYLPGSIKHLNMLLGEQLTEGEGGGGETWQTVFEGSVTTVMSVDFALADITDLESLSGDSIKVTFNGTEYILPKVADGYGAMTQDEMPDFSEYPLFIVTLEQPYTIYTETAGTYTLKIEEPQSGGSSDFSTAEVTVTITDENANITLPVVMSSPQEGLGLQTLSYGMAHNGLVVNIALYKGVTITIPTVGLGNLAVTGNAEISNGAVIITGDCTITIEGGLS